MKLKNSVIVILSVVLLSFSCKKLFFEPDLTKSTVTYIAPANNSKVTSPVITFWWNPIEGATKYNLMVVSPSFDPSKISKLILDTNITSTQFQTTLYPDSFEWRVVAINGYTKSSVYDIYKLTVDSTQGLYDVVLLYPVNNLATKDTSIAFKWMTQPNADNYRFVLNKDGVSAITPQYISTGEIKLPQDISQLTTLEEGTYEWKVQALGSSPPSNYTTRNFVIDRTAPSLPVLKTPSNNAAITLKPITLSWTLATDAGSIISDSIIIASDTAFKTIVESAFVSSTSYQLVKDVAGDYYWKVKSIDAAGNKSSYSNYWKFTIK